VIRCVSCGARFVSSDFSCCSNQSLKQANEVHRPSGKIVVCLPVGKETLIYLAECIAWLNRSHTPIELWIVGDACEVPKISSRWTTELRITKENVGPYAIANAVARECEGEWLAIQDGDDLSLPHRFAASLSAAAGFDHLSGAMANFTDSDSAALKARVIASPLLTSTAMRQVNGVRMIRVSVFRQLKGFAKLRYSADSEFDRRCAAEGVKTTYIREVLGLRRIHERAATVVHRLHRDRVEARQVLAGAIDSAPVLYPWSCDATTQNRYRICDVCDHSLPDSSGRCKLLVDRGYPGVIAHPRGAPREATRCPIGKW
jgi:hypothetical protein